MNISLNYAATVDAVAVVAADELLMRANNLVNAEKSISYHICEKGVIFDMRRWYRISLD